jgi:hypothetical protein
MRLPCKREVAAHPFRTPRHPRFFPRTREPQSRDVNGDGPLDIVTGNYATSTVTELDNAP